MVELASNQDEEAAAVPASEWGHQYGFTEEAVISRIEKGIIEGFRQGAEWYVVVRDDVNEQEQEEDGQGVKEVEDESGSESEGNGKRRCRNSFGLRAKVYGLIFVLTMIWTYISEKTGYHYSRPKGLYKKHDPKGSIESFGATLEDLPLLIFLFVLVIAGVEVYEKFQRYRSAS